MTYINGWIMYYSEVDGPGGRYRRGRRHRNKQDTSMTDIKAPLEDAPPESQQSENTP
jgi:hypothetical protein